MTRFQNRSKIFHYSVIFVSVLGFQFCTMESMTFLQFMTEYGGGAEKKIHENGEGQVDRRAQAVLVSDEQSEIFGTSALFQEGSVKENDVIDVKITQKKDFTISGEPNVQVIQFEPEGYEFDVPVTIGLPYGHFDDPILDDLVIVHFDPDTEELTPLATSDISEDTKIIFAETTHFSYFFVSNQGISVEVFSDSRDGKEYEFVKIGNQIWMAENLNYESQSSLVYDGNSTNASTYGRLYTFEDAKTVCPGGWHLPSDDEWITMEKFIGLPDNEVDLEWARGGDIGGKLKEKGATLWSSPNSDATNSTRFSARPGGMAESSSSFTEITHSAYFWTSTPSEGGMAWYRSLYYSDSYVFRLEISDNSYFSVRCVKN